MWTIVEHRSLAKVCRALPMPVLKKYELWKDIVNRHGPEKLREFRGFNDEQLSGDRQGQRSSRLNIKYRVVYSVEKAIVVVCVLEITPHKY